MQRKIFKTGHSLAVSLSKSVLNKAGLKVGDVVDVEFGDNKIIIYMTKKGKQMGLPLKIRAKL